MSVNVTGVTMNGTQSMSTCFNSTAVRIGCTFAYCLLTVVSLAGNTFIGIIVYRTKTLRTPINFLMVNMAMSDLLYPIIFFTTRLTGIYKAGHWLISGPLGQALCKLSVFAGDVSTLVSVQSLVLITVDRFVAVVFPLRSPSISSRQGWFSIIAIWIVAMAVHCPYLFAFKVVEYSDGLVCWLQWNDTFGESSYEGYFLGIIIVVVYVPLVSIAILYFAIALTIKFQKSPGEQSANVRKQHLRRERKVLKLSIAVVLVFAVCWLPFSIMVLFLLFSLDSAMISSCMIQDGFVSDHDPVLFDIKLHCGRSCKSSPRQVYDFKIVNLEDLYELFHWIPWNGAFLEDDVNSAAVNVTDLILAAADDCIPKFVVKKKLNPPWITREGLRFVKKKRKLGVFSKSYDLEHGDSHPKEEVGPGSLISVATCPSEVKKIL
ncbi:substance-K receptor-like, partial [Stylophora pistillata]|uniref:substance-K receptor-like n=1 Tax=Stylophora pistillata TaxID=50429 RepID=UPI000C047F27